MEVSNQIRNKEVKEELLQEELILQVVMGLLEGTH
jgi:hypothetical protein